MKAEKRIVCAALLLFVGTLSRAYAVCYVDVRATGSNSGASWRDAYVDLQSALKNSACKEVWVAKGVYKPAPDVDRAANFNINPGVAVYGGFAGREATRSSRNPKSNVTVLSGDIGNDDANVAGNEIDATWNDIHGDNSIHVVRMDGTSGAPVVADTVLDGFTITGGNADGSYPDAGGGGLYCGGSASGHVCSPTLSNVIFSGNKGQYGALFNDASFGGISSPTLTHMLFAGNFANTRGGAIYDDATFGGVSSPNLVDVIFDANLSDFGGAMYNDGSYFGDSSPSFIQVTFEGNGTGSGGGAIFNDGGNSGHSSPMMFDATFRNNSAEAGGAIYNDGAAAGESSPELINVTFYDNEGAFGAIYDDASDSGQSSPRLASATFSGNGGNFCGAICVSEEGARNASLTLNNVIMWDDRVSEEVYGFSSLFIDHSIIKGGCPAASTCTSVTSSDPLLSSLSDHGGLTWTMLPSASSPAIDSGDDDHSVCPATDQRGDARPQGKHCDIGAVERQHAEDIIFKDGFDPF